MRLIVVLIRGHTAEIQSMPLSDASADEEQLATELVQSMTGERKPLDTGTHKVDGAQVARR